MCRVVLPTSRSIQRGLASHGTIRRAATIRQIQTHKSKLGSTLHAAGLPETPCHLHHHLEMRPRHTGFRRWCQQPSVPSRRRFPEPGGRPSSVRRVRWDCMCPQRPEELALSGIRGQPGRHLCSAGGDSPGQNLISRPRQGKLNKSVLLCWRFDIMTLQLPHTKSVKISLSKWHWSGYFGQKMVWKRGSYFCRISNMSLNVSNLSTSFALNRTRNRKSFLCRHNFIIELLESGRRSREGRQGMGTTLSIKRLMEKVCGISTVRG